MTRTRALLLAAAIAAVALLAASCPNPLKAVLEDITVKAFNPVISVWFGAVEVPAGGSFDIGEVAAEVSEEVVLTIRNLGKVELSVSDVDFDGAAASIFTVSGGVSGL